MFIRGTSGEAGLSRKTPFGQRPPMYRRAAHTVPGMSIVIIVVPVAVTVRVESRPVAAAGATPLALARHAIVVAVHQRAGAMIKEESRLGAGCHLRASRAAVTAE